MPTPQVRRNGVNGASGQYLEPALSLGEVARLARGEALEPAARQELAAKRDEGLASFGVAHGVDPEDLAQAGWAVVFADDADPAVREALAPLLALRQAQAGPRYRELSGKRGHRRGQGCRAFLAEQSAGPGPVDPAKFPYYVLLVGDPERIPFRFQSELDVSYAVGRLHLEGAAAYAAYARSAVAAEARQARARRRLVLWGTRNPDDEATASSADLLVGGLGKALTGRPTPGWEVEPVIGEGATKQRLTSLLSPGAAPEILFTASHGMGFPPGDPRLPAAQGALLCQDWPGPVRHRGPIPSDWYLAAADLPSSTRLGGLVAFHFACYSAGTPSRDDFAPSGQLGAPLAPRPFLAALPTRMLGLEQGGALAVVGHVDQAWGYSFDWPGAGAQLATFDGALRALMEGSRVGAAMEYFGMRYADLAVGLQGELDDVKLGKVPDELELADLWVGTRDARNYVILGDPAVRAA